MIEFTAQDLDGNPVSLADYKDKVILVNFWASWCTPCITELPILQAYYHARQEDGFVLVGVNVSEDAEDAAQFLRDNNYDFPAWSDPPGNALIQLRANGLPFSLLIDREGRLLDRWMGPLTEEILETAVTPLLQGNPE